VYQSLVVPFFSKFIFPSYPSIITTTIITIITIIIVITILILTLIIIITIIFIQGGGEPQLCEQALERWALLAWKPRRLKPVRAAGAGGTRTHVAAGTGEAASAREIHCVALPRGKERESRLTDRLHNPKHCQFLMTLKLFFYLFRLIIASFFSTSSSSLTSSSSSCPPVTLLLRAFLSLSSHSNKRHATHTHSYCCLPHHIYSWWRR
jgi:hypothetical protein